MRYRVEQWTVDGWAELGLCETFEEADELALAVRAAGAFGVRVVDILRSMQALVDHRGDGVLWSVEGLPR